MEILTELKIEANALHSILKRLSPVVLPSPIVPILECVLVEFGTEQVMFTASDLHNEIAIYTPYEGSGMFLMPHRMMLNLTKTMGKEELTIVASKQDKQYFLDITTEDKSYRIATENPVDYVKPMRKQPTPGAQGQTIDTKSIREAFAFVKHSIANDELRPSMCGVSFKINFSGAELATTDGHSLSIFRLPQWAGPVSTQFIVRKSLVKIIDSFKCETLDLKWTGSTLLISGGDCLYVGKLIDEKYPNYGGILETKEKQSSVTFDTRPLAQSIARVKLFSNTHTRQIVFILTSSRVVLAAQEYDYGHKANETAVTTTPFDGKPMEMGFNASYFGGILKQFPAGFTMHTTAASKAATFTCSDERKFALLMPIALNNYQI